MKDLNLSTLAPIYPEVLEPLPWEAFGWGLGSMVVVMGIGIGLWYRARRVPQASDPLLELLKLDLDAYPTESLYRFSLLMQSLPHEQQPDNLSELLDLLEPYKYTPDPPPLPEAIKLRVIQAIREVAE